MVISDERPRQLSWNLTAQDSVSPHSQCVHGIISSQIELTPDAVAVEAGDSNLTYRQLDDRAAAIASRLMEAGAGTGSVVAVLLDRTPDLVAAIMGILKSGAAFLPLDPSQPATRNNLSINDADANIVLTDRQVPTGGDAVEATVINLGDVGPDATRGAPSATVSPADLAYVIYTSGSTGRPKGVLIEHRSVTNLMQTMFREFGVTASDTVLSVSSISFDVALGDIFCALACGARLVLATAAQATNPAALIRLIADSRATYMMATPTTFGALVAAGWRGNRRLTVASIGETLTDGLAAALLQRCGAVWNTYGPTETTVITSVARLAEGDTVTVGRPLPNVRVYITDPRLRLQPVGVPGEIAIGGVAVGRGYRNRPDEHARRYGDDPFVVGGRIYRTGDRGRLLPDGRIQHLGRYDDQLKIRGFRIEPGEIESTLCEHPDVGCCAVVAREAPNGERQLVAYIVGKAGCPSDAEARGWLRTRLPEYMIPSAFVRLSALPQTASGKLDKAALPAPSPREIGRIGAPPRNDTELRVAELWSDVLGVPVIDVNSDFFDVGGHSLLAARLISDVRQAFGVALSPTSFLDSGRTIAKLAELLGAESLSRTEEVPSALPLHFIFSDPATAMSMRRFTAQWGAAQPLYALIPEQPGGRFDLSMTIEHHASQALSAIRNRQPDGPLALVGYSFGGLVAYEVARQAVDAGQQVEWLGILDELAPSMAELQWSQLSLWWRLRRIRRLPARQRWAKYREVALRVLRRGELWPQGDFDIRGATEIECRFQQPGHEVPTHLFVSEVTAAAAEADLLGWDEYHKGPLTVHRLTGDHVSLFAMPEVEKLARSMLESLCKARANRVPAHDWTGRCTPALQGAPNAAFEAGRGACGSSDPLRKDPHVITLARRAAGDHSA
jgi:amino acid adenylation domain-containing protein